MKFYYVQRNTQLERIPLLEKEGWLRHQSRSREATEEPQTGWSLTQHVSETHSETRLVSDHPVRAFSERIYFVNGASTPPCQGGECVCPVIGDKHYVGHHASVS